MKPGLAVVERFIHTMSHLWILLIFCLIVLAGGIYAIMEMAKP